MIDMVSGNLFHCRKHSWPSEEYVSRATLQLLDFDSAAPPAHAWRRRLNSHANILKEFSVTFMEALKMMRLGVRLWSYVREEASHGRKAPIDPFTRESCKPSASQGVPLGGMGSGSISRGFRGEFRHIQIIPGICETSPIMANQFSIFISRDGGNKKYSTVLAPGQHEGLGKSGDQGISSWNWNLSGQHSTYHALFPRAWTIYDGEPDPELKVSCRQISPFIPHNYQDSSLPTAVFVYTLVNTGKERAKVSLLMTWANSIGGCSHQSGNHVNEAFIGEDGVSGVLLHHKTAKDNPPVTFAIAACETQNVNVTVLPCFGLTEQSRITAKAMWDKMSQDGCFDHGNFNAGPCMPSSPGETQCAAVSASAWVEPHGKCTVAFALAWSSPKVKFRKGSSYNRRYTRFYGTSERSALDLVHDALMIKEAEHLGWNARLRIAMGVAYCLEHIHQLNPPVIPTSLNSTAIYLSEDYAAKISGFSFWNGPASANIGVHGPELLDTQTSDKERNIYHFGIILLEMVTGRLPYTLENGQLVHWALEYFRTKRPVKYMVDPILQSFEEEKLEKLCKVIIICIHPDSKQRPTMREVTALLREITAMAPDGATPRLSPLWWAELEIISAVSN